MRKIAFEKENATPEDIKAYQKSSHGQDGVEAFHFLKSLQQMYQVILEKSVQKFLEKHRGEDLIQKFEKALTILALDPYENNLDIKVLV